VPSVVHQISTPLAAIALRAESLEASAADEERGIAPEKLQRYLRAIGEESRRCQQMLASLREFAGKVAPGTEGVSVDALCRSAAQLVRDEAMRKQIEVVLDLEAALPEVRGKKCRLGQALLALLLNAVDASPPGGRVLVEVRTEVGRKMALAVSDEGEGMSDEVVRSLFEPFGSGRSPEEGIGLGLMASRIVAETHGGSLEWETTLGRGSRFVLRVPIDGASPANGG
jgi:signal transduction histidine kinase